MQSVKQQWSMVREYVAENIPQYENFDWHEHNISSRMKGFDALAESLKLQ